MKSQGPGRISLSRQLFLTEEADTKMHPAVQYENHLYLNHSGNPNQMKCLTMDGKVVWEEGEAPALKWAR